VRQSAQEEYDDFEPRHPAVVQGSEGKKFVRFVDGNKGE
jgi:hypothetical protein